MRTIELDKVIEKTTERYAELRITYLPGQTPLSRQVIALAEVLTTEMNDSLEELQSWITPPDDV